jgi:hypothetical protein
VLKTNSQPLGRFLVTALQLPLTHGHGGQNGQNPLLYIFFYWLLFSSFSLSSNIRTRGGNCPILPYFAHLNNSHRSNFYKIWWANGGQNQESGGQNRANGGQNLELVLRFLAGYVN